MFCKNCGKEIPDESVKCPFCYAEQFVTSGVDTENAVYNVTDSHNTEVSPVKCKVTFFIKIALCILGILMGLLLVINTFAGDDFFFDKGLSYYGASAQDGGLPVTFGADFYTEIHDEARIIANNTESIAYDIEKLGYLLKSAFEIIYIAAGSFMVLFFGIKLCSVIDSKKSN